jgi:hypothetical protein
MNGVSPAHVCEPRRDAELRKERAALGHRGAQSAPRVHELAHSGSGHMQPRGGQRRPDGGLSDDARIEPPPIGEDRFARKLRLAEGKRLTDANVLVEHGTD